MKLLRIKAITKKEIIQIWRDPYSLALAFLMPLNLILLYGYAISFDVDKITTVVYDQDKTSISRELIAEFVESQYFKIVSYVADDKEINSYLDADKARVAIIIPNNFSQKVERGENTQVGIIIDGSDSNTANIAEGYIAGIAQMYAQKKQGGKITLLIDARARVWYNPELKSRNFIIPGVIVIIMAVVVAMLTSLTVAKEWERGTMEQLISTPIHPSELIIGKLIPYFIIGFIDLTVAIFLAVFLFAVPLNGNIFLLLLLSSLFLFGGVCQGIVISVNSGGSQQVASQIAMLSTFLPAFMLSGFIYAIDNMPKFLQMVTYIVPARYFVTILKGIFLKGNGLKILWLEALLLIIYGAWTFTTANKRFKKRLD